jgi:excisionase family DNA binding protein
VTVAREEATMAANSLVHLKSSQSSVGVTSVDRSNLLDIPTLAIVLGTSVRHVRRLVLEKRIPYMKIGGLIRFDPSDVREWIDGQKVRPTGRGRQV